MLELISLQSDCRQVGLSAHYPLEWHCYSLLVFTNPLNVFSILQLRSVVAVPIPVFIFFINFFRLSAFLLFFFGWLFCLACYYLFVHVLLTVCCDFRLEFATEDICGSRLDVGDVDRVAMPIIEEVNDDGPATDARSASQSGAGDGAAPRDSSSTFSRLMVCWFCLV